MGLIGPEIMRVFEKPLIVLKQKKGSLASYYRSYRLYLWLLLYQFLQRRGLSVGRRYADVCQARARLYLL